MPDREHIIDGATRQHSGVVGNNHKVAWIYDSTRTFTIFGNGPMEDYDADYQVAYTYVDYYSGSDNACVVDEDDFYGKVIKEKGITRIGKNVFCSARNLTDVYYAGLKLQWHNISFDSYNETLIQAVIHLNSGAPSGSGAGTSSGESTGTKRGGKSKQSIKLSKAKMVLKARTLLKKKTHLQLK